MRTLFAFRTFCVLLCFSLFSLATADAADVLQLREGDRVLLIGSTIVEREQSFGYWETALSTAKPEVNFSLRNLGWSGDTVWCDSRAGFETAEYGFNELQKLVETLQPTLVVVAYGFNESFAGEAGLEKFKAGLKRLTDMLSATKARIVLVSPTRMENRVGKFPDHTADNQRVLLYRNAIEEFAKEQNFGFGDWTDSVIPPAGPAPLSEDQALTDNGLHLTEVGYWKTSRTLANLAGAASLENRLTIDLAGKKIDGLLNAADPEWNASAVSFSGKSKQLPTPPDPRTGQIAPYSIAVGGLNPQTRYQLTVEDQPVAAASGTEWSRGVAIAKHPDYEQVEQLRQTILRKNELFFYRWRPQNVTYLFGFRKHEQGQNAKEVAEFEPLVKEHDKQISELKLPRSLKYRLAPVEEGK